MSGWMDGWMGNLDLPKISISLTILPLPWAKTPPQAAAVNMQIHHTE